MAVLFKDWFFFSISIIYMTIEYAFEGSRIGPATENSHVIKSPKTGGNLSKTVYTHIRAI